MYIFKNYFNFPSANGEIKYSQIIMVKFGYPGNRHCHLRLQNNFTENEDIENSRCSECCPMIMMPSNV